MLEISLFPFSEGLPSPSPMSIPAFPRSLYLGSQSRTKLRVLAELGVHVVPVPAYADEEVEVIPENVGEMVIEVAQRKVDILVPGLRAIPQSELLSNVLLCTDVVLQDIHGNVNGKPADEDQARVWLNGYVADGSFHVFVGMIAVNLLTGVQASASSRETIRFVKDFTPESLEQYIASGDPMRGCGALYIDNECFAEHVVVDGELSSVQGLSKTLAVRLIHEVLSSK